MNLEQGKRLHFDPLKWPWRFHVSILGNSNLTQKQIYIYGIHEICTKLFVFIEVASIVLILVPV